MAENSKEKTYSGGGHASAPTCASVSDLPHTFADVPKTTLHTMDHSGAKPETPTSERRRATDCTMDTLAKTLDFQNLRFSSNRKVQGPSSLSLLVKVCIALLTGIVLLTPACDAVSTVCDQDSWFTGQVTNDPSSEYYSVTDLCARCGFLALGVTDKTTRQIDISLFDLDAKSWYNTFYLTESNLQISGETLSGEIFALKLGFYDYSTVSIHAILATTSGKLIIWSQDDILDGINAQSWVITSSVTTFKKSTSDLLISQHNNLSRNLQAVYAFAWSQNQNWSVITVEKSNNGNNSNMLVAEHTISLYNTSDKVAAITKKATPTSDSDLIYVLAWTTDPSNSSMYELGLCVYNQVGPVQTYVRQLATQSTMTEVKAVTYEAATNDHIFVAQSDGQGRVNYQSIEFSASSTAISITNSIKVQWEAVLAQGGQELSFEALVARDSSTVHLVIGMKSTISGGDKIYIVKTTNTGGVTSVEELSLQKTQQTIVDHSFSTLLGNLAVSSQLEYLSILSQNQLQIYEVGLTTNTLCSTASIAQSVSSFGNIDQVTLSFSVRNLLVASNVSSPLLFGTAGTFDYTKSSNMISESAYSSFYAIQNPNTWPIVNPCGLTVPEIAPNQEHSDPLNTAATLSDITATAAAYNFCPGESTLPNETNYGQFLHREILDVTMPDDPSVDYSSQINDEIAFQSTGIPGALVLAIDDSADEFWQGGTHQIEYKRAYGSSMASPEWADISYSTQDFFVYLPSPLTAATAWLASEVYILDDTQPYSTSFEFPGATESATFGDVSSSLVEYDATRTNPIGPTSDAVYDSATSTLTLTRTGTADQELHFKHTVYYVDYPSVFAEQWFVIQAYYCPMLPPNNLKSIYRKEFQDGVDEQIISFDADKSNNGLCGYTVSLSFNGSAIDPSIFTLQSGPAVYVDNGQLAVATTDISVVGVYSSFELEMTSVDYLVASESFTFDVEIFVNCQLSLPSILVGNDSFEYDLADMVSSPIATFDLSDAENTGVCDFTSSLTGHETHAPYLSVQYDNGQLVSVSLDTSLLNNDAVVIELTYTMTSNVPSQTDSPLSKQFTITTVPIVATGPIATPDEVATPSCDPEFVIEGLSDSYTYTIGNPVTIISLDGIISNNCTTYTLSLTDADTGEPADAQIFTLTQSSFESSDSDVTFIVSEAGLIEAGTVDQELIGSYNLQLTVSDQSHNSEVSTASFAFSVDIKGCQSIMQSSLTELEEIYQVGDLKMTIDIGAQNPTCQNSAFKLKLVQPAEVLPTFITFSDETQSASIEVRTTELENAGTYIFEVVQTDTLTGLRAVTRVNLIVLSPFVAITNTAANITINTSSEAIQNLVDSFMVDLYSQYSQGGKQNPDGVPLVAKVFDFSATSNLTITFNKPLIKMPLRVLNETESDQRRRKLELAESEDPSEEEVAAQLAEKMKCLSIPLPVSCVLDVSVLPAFDVEDESQQIRVTDYYLTRYDQDSMDVQVVFNYPEILSVSKPDPDYLYIDFVQGAFFTDEQDFFNLERQLEIDIEIPQQIDAEDEAELTEFEKTLAKTMASFSVGNLILNIVLAAGMEHLWKMVNLLQFVIFMRKWLIGMPRFTDSWLKSLQTLALFEFLPNDKIIAWFSETTNIKNDKKKQKSTVEDLLVFIMAGGCILMLCLILIFVTWLAKVSEKCKRIKQSLRRKLLYGSFIRYILLGTLKIQIELCTGLAVGVMIKATEEQPVKHLGFKVFALIIFILLQLCPAFFAWVLCRNRKNLDKPQVKQKIGVLYQGLQPEKPYVGTYSIVFLLRRNIFIFVTFLLLRQPGLQVQFMLTMTTSYICYICQMHFYTTRGRRRTEIFNELLLAAICVLYTIFVDPCISQNPDVRDGTGTSVIVVVCILLGFNTLLIMQANCQAVKTKCKRRAAKKRLLKWQEEQKEKALQKQKLGPQESNQIEIKAKTVTQGSQLTKQAGFENGNNGNIPLDRKFIEAAFVKQPKSGLVLNKKQHQPVCQVIEEEKKGASQQSSSISEINSSSVIEYSQYESEYKPISGQSLTPPGVIDKIERPNEVQKPQRRPLIDSLQSFVSGELPNSLESFVSSDSDASYQDQYTHPQMFISHPPPYVRADKSETSADLLLRPQGEAAQMATYPAGLVVQHASAIETNEQKDQKKRSQLTKLRYRDQDNIKAELPKQDDTKTQKERVQVMAPDQKTPVQQVGTFRQAVVGLDTEPNFQRIEQLLEQMRVERRETGGRMSQGDQSDRQSDGRGLEQVDDIQKGNGREEKANESDMSDLRWD